MSSVFRVAALQSVSHNLLHSMKHVSLQLPAALYSLRVADPSDQRLTALISLTRISNIKDTFIVKNQMTPLSEENKT